MSRTRTSPLRPIARFIAHVMIVSGVLLVANAAVTVLWQEPVSAVTANREQGELERAFEDPPARARVIKRSPLPGDAIGKLDIPRLDKDFFVVEGTKTEDLRRGPGHYEDTPLPGERGTVAIAGHRTTYGAPFRNVDQLRSGDRIIVEMPYGTFTYRVETTKIVPPTALYVKRKVSYDRLILSACHPLYSAAQRIVVFARLEARGDSKVRRRR